MKAMGLEEKARRMRARKFPELKKRRKREGGSTVKTLDKSLDMIDEILKAMYPTSKIVAQAGAKPYGTAGEGPAGSKETKQALSGVGVGKETGKVMGQMKEMKEAKQGKETTAALRDIGVGGKSAQKSQPGWVDARGKGTSYSGPKSAFDTSATSAQEQAKMGKKAKQFDDAKKSGPALYVDGEEAEKALTAAFMPRLSRAQAAQLRMQRSGTDAMTRGNSRFAKDIHTGPLTGEVIEDLEEDAAMRTRQALPMYKSCCVCGRTYMAKSQDAECPTCSMNKSMLCTCGHALVKSAGSHTRCPICQP